MPDAMFNDMKPDFARLRAFGFAEIPGGYRHASVMVDGQFELVLTVADSGSVHAEVIELASHEPYVLHLVPGACGAFVGRVREEYEAVLTAVARQCFVRDVFKSNGAKQVIEYIWSAYQDEPEYLWAKFPRNAIFRRKDNAKWYAALLVLPVRKLGLPDDRIVDIIDLRIDPQSVAAVVDGKRCFPGYHMNKKHWISLCLDGSVPEGEVVQRIDASYRLAARSR